VDYGEDKTTVRFDSLKDYHSNLCVMANVESTWMSFLSCHTSQLRRENLKSRPASSKTNGSGETEPVKRLDRSNRLLGSGNVKGYLAGLRPGTLAVLYCRPTRSILSISRQGHDDAIAILLAVRCPGVSLLGVSTVCPSLSPGCGETGPLMRLLGSWKCQCGVYTVERDQTSLRVRCRSRC
jgi:hypothetical protein